MGARENLLLEEGTKNASPHWMKTDSYHKHLDIFVHIKMFVTLLTTFLLQTCLRLRLRHRTD